MFYQSLYRDGMLGEFEEADADGHPPSISAYFICIVEQGDMRCLYGRKGPLERPLGFYKARDEELQRHGACVARTRRNWSVASANCIVSTGENRMIAEDSPEKSWLSLWEGE